MLKLKIYTNYKYMSNFFKNILNDMDGKGDSSLLGPQYSYYKQINTPKEMGMSSDGTTEAIENDVNGLINYVRLLIEGGGPASKVPGPLGNKYFLKTAASCTDKASGELVTRSLYFNNVPDGSIPFLSEALGEDFTTWEGLLPGVLEDIEKINPLGIFQAFVEGKNPDCRAITMQVRDISNNNSNQTAYVTDNDIKGMDPCWFSDHKNPVTGESRTNCNMHGGAGGDERCSDPSNCIILTGTNSYSPGSVELDGNIALTTPGFKQKQIGCFTLDGADAIENTTWQQKLKDGPKCRVSSINVPDNMDVVALAGTGGAWTNNFCEIADPVTVGGSIYLRSGPNDLPSNTCGFKFTPKCSDISCIKIAASDGTYIWLDTTIALTKFGTGQKQVGCWSLDNNHMWEAVLKTDSGLAEAFEIIGAIIGTIVLGVVTAGAGDVIEAGVGSASAAIGGAASAVGGAVGSVAAGLGVGADAVATSVASAFASASAAVSGAVASAASVLGIGAAGDALAIGGAGIEMMSAAELAIATDAIGDAAATAAVSVGTGMAATAATAVANAAAAALATGASLAASISAGATAAAAIAAGMTASAAGAAAAAAMPAIQAGIVAGAAAAMLDQPLHTVAANAAKKHIITSSGHTVCDVATISLPKNIQAVAYSSGGGWNSLCTQEFKGNIPANSKNFDVTGWGPPCGFLFKEKFIEGVTDMSNIIITGKESSGAAGLSVKIDSNVATEGKGTKDAPVPANSSMSDGAQAKIWKWAPGTLQKGCWTFDTSKDWQKALKWGNQCNAQSISLPPGIKARAYYDIPGGWDKLCDTKLSSTKPGATTKFIDIPEGFQDAGLHKNTCGFRFWKCDSSACPIPTTNWDSTYNPAGDDGGGEEGFSNINSPSVILLNDNTITILDYLYLIAILLFFCYVLSKAAKSRK
jgi:hypothetical protein